jgi:hypothetical protein
MDEFNRLGLLTGMQVRARAQAQSAQQQIPWQMLGGITISRRDDFYVVSAPNGEELFEICIRTKDPDVEAAFAYDWLPGVFIKSPADDPGGILQVMVSFTPDSKAEELLPNA